MKKVLEGELIVRRLLDPSVADGVFGCSECLTEAL